MRSSADARRARRARSTLPAPTTPGTPPTSRAPLGRRFLVVWFGQTVSEVGTMLSGIGAAVYVFVQTGSAMWLGLLAAVAALPAVLVSPLTKLIDRWPRRRTMIGADLVAASGPALALGLAVTGRLEVWHLALAGFIAGLGNAFQMPASQASVPALVEPDALDRANSLKQLGPALGIVIGPVLATPIVAWWGIEAILVIDAVSFLVGVSAVALVPFDDHRDPQPIDDDGTWTATWVWLRGPGRPLLTLMGATAVVNFVLAFFNVSIIALATDVTGTAMAGVVLGAGGCAMLVGAIVAAQRGLPEDRVGAFARSVLLMSIGLTIAAVRPHLLPVLLGVVVALGSVPVVNASISTVFNERVPASMQGRVFAVRGALSQALQPAGSALAGVTIAHVAAPAISEGGALQGSLGAVIGDGPQRGVAVILLACAAVLALVAVALRRSDLRAELASGEAPPIVEQTEHDTATTAP